MEIMATGGAGFSGSHVIDLYLSSGYGVVIADDLSTGHDSSSNPRMSSYKVNIRVPKLDKDLEQTINNQHGKEVLV